MANDITLLLEIGVEEIPATFLPAAIGQLKDVTEGVLSDNGVEFSDVRAYATPRRLTVIATGVSGHQKNRITEHFGPPQKAAFSDDGKPTRAAISFAQLHGIAVEDLIIKQKTEHNQSGKNKQKGGQYVVAVIRTEGRAIGEIAASLFTKIVTSLHFPKAMRWADLDTRFVRPVRWLLALCDGAAVEFEFAGVKSSNVTHGHRFLANVAIEVSDAAQYHDTLEANYVIIDQDKRRQLIWAQCQQAASEFGALPVADDALLQQVTHLVEYPHAVAGEFEEVYLGLPRELLITVMRDHQRCFAIETQDGRLLNRFIVVSNTVADNADVVRIGAQRVIRARLEDARFYYDEDLKLPLIQRLEHLKGIVFQDALGSVFDKVERLAAIGDFLRLRLFDPIEIDREQLLMAIRLCKADLTTGVVRQFPELQGVMGKYYALKNGHEPEVAQAIVEHYLPAFAGDKIPSTKLAMIVSLADKLDNLVSFFSIGQTPTGSEDPYGLRRQAIGVIAVLLQGSLGVTVEDILTGVADVLKRPVTVLDDLYAFFRQRLQALFSTMGYSHDVIQAVMERFQCVQLNYLVGRMDALRRLKGQQGYNEFLIAFKRIYNIAPRGMDGTYVVNVHLMQGIAERGLYDALGRIRQGVEAAVAGGEFRRALELLTELVAPINEFFDKVLVMDKDEAQRVNRLALLRDILSAAATVADLSRMQESQDLTKAKNV
ncbi:glycine--tRNA ligase subunit beta [Candidatus Magnetobacterium casense]|uniref:glycine--tRNA ligase subunit beta n=1 Tax=Candidatus Magnetobacterium casense TaxID=1455061 RepID=UPI00058EF246|nr:glycine--tRNA ligase subunit beta [Candidatus Magnetobacterium casensis]